MIIRKKSCLGKRVYVPCDTREDKEMSRIGVHDVKFTKKKINKRFIKIIMNNNNNTGSWNEGLPRTQFALATNN